MWNELYNAAVKVQNSRTISPFIDAGGVAAAILTKQGNVYVGVCIDTASISKSLPCKKNWNLLT